MKLIGIQQNDYYYLIYKLDNTKKVTLPYWIDKIERVLYIPDTEITIDDIEEDLSNYIKNAYNMSRVNKFIYDRLTDDYKYLIREGSRTMFFNIDEGFVIILYSSIPIDEEGNPLIPNEINLIKALVWYNIKEKLWEITFKNPNRFVSLFQKAEQEWSYYSIQAKTASIIPKTEDEMRGLMNKYMKILPNFNK